MVFSDIVYYYCDTTPRRGAVDGADVHQRGGVRAADGAARGLRGGRAGGRGARARPRPAPRRPRPRLLRGRGARREARCECFFFSFLALETSGQSHFSVTHHDCSIFKIVICF